MSRLKYLENKFKVFTTEEIEKKVEGLDSDGIVLKRVIGAADYPLITYYSYPQHNSRKKRKIKYFLNVLVFDAIVDCDPTEHKMYVQWLLNLVTHMVGKVESYDAGTGDNTFIRTIEEDLGKTRLNLILFEENKRKKRFIEACSGNYGLKGIEDPLNINQYDNLEQLVAATFPFKETVSASDLEKKLFHFVEIGQAKMPVRDENCTVFIPLTLAASELFSFTNWCTATKGNTNFKSYRNNQCKADGSLSDLIVLIKNSFFSGDSEDIYQLHVESNQFMDKKDRTYNNFKEEFLPTSLSLRNYIREYLGDNYKLALNNHHKSNETNYYKRIMEFGMCEILFDIINDDAPTISFRNVGIDKIPSLTRFNRLSGLYLDKVGIKTLNPEMFQLKTLQMLSIPFNNIVELPDTIGEATELIFMNLAGNPIERIPPNIQYLDITKGGKLRRISLDEKNINLVEDLRRYLPSIEIMGIGLEVG